MVLKQRFSTTKFFEVLVIGFITIQIISWLLSKYYDLELLKGGWILLIFLVAIALISLWRLGKKLGDLTKFDVFFILFEFTVLLLLFIYIPKYFSEIFSSYSLETFNIIKNSIGSIIPLP